MWEQHRDLTFKLLQTLLEGQEISVPKEIVG